jgi:hypothetical protein
VLSGRPARTARRSSGTSDDAIDHEFSAVCRAIWGFTLDDFTDDDLSAEDHAWLDELTRECAIDFAAEQGYDLKDYVHGGCVAGWWGFTWRSWPRRAACSPRRSGLPRGAGTAREPGGRESREVVPSRSIELQSYCTSE